MPTPPDPGVSAALLASTALLGFLGVQTLATIVRGVLMVAAFGRARERMRAAGLDPAVTPFTEIVGESPAA